MYVYKVRTPFHDASGVMVQRGEEYSQEQYDALSFDQQRNLIRTSA